MSQVEREAEKIDELVNKKKKYDGSNNTVLIFDKDVQNYIQN